MGRPYQDEHDLAVEAVRQAAALCRAVGAGITPQSMAKRDRSPVTVADFGSQALICRALAGAFPDDPVIAEEDASELLGPGGDPIRDRVIERVRDACPEADAESVARWIDHGGARDHSARFWTLDPIDGTKGFLRGEQYAVSLALIVDGRIEVAALACPNLPIGASQGAVFSAVRGQGALARPLDGDGPAESICVSPEVDPTAARFCESVESGHSAQGDAAEVARLLGIAAPPIRMDSQAKYATVARGDAEIYLRLPTRPGYREKVWDHAAGVLVVEEAGGVVTDIMGRPLEFTHGSELAVNLGVIVTNGRLHGRVLDAVATFGLRPRETP